MSQRISFRYIYDESIRRLDNTDIIGLIIDYYIHMTRVTQEVFIDRRYSVFPSDFKVRILPINLIIRKATEAMAPYKADLLQACQAINPGDIDAKCDERAAQLKVKIDELNAGLASGAVTMTDSQEKAKIMTCSFDRWDIDARRFTYAESFIAFLNSCMPGLTDRLGIDDPRVLYTGLADYKPETFIGSGGNPTGRVSFPKAGVSIEIGSPGYYGIGSQQSAPITITSPSDQGLQSLVCYF